MRRLLLLLFVSMVTFVTAIAASPTWSSDVAPILYRACVSCHHEGGIAPFPLLTFEDAAIRADLIAEEVEERAMPPYPADTKYRRYAHERTLTEAEIAIIKAWADAGTPAGDLATAPPPPKIQDGPMLRTPDLIVTMPTYTSQATNADVYRCFTMRTNESQDRYIDALEILPGNASIVHHVLVFVDTTDTSERLDAADPEPGYVGFGGVGSQTAELLGLYAPGALPYTFPRGFGQRLPKGARVIFQMHYPAGTQGEVDATSLRLRFSTSDAVRPVMISPVLNQGNMTNGPLFIPANTVKTFRQRYTIPVDVSLFAVAPHMHLVGTSARVWAVAPSSDTIPIVRIPHWDFHWQMAYTFPTLLRLPRNTKVESEFVYDNTAANKNNPSDPPRNVRLGEATTDEMMLTFFYYTFYLPGDENIRLDVQDAPTSVPTTPRQETLSLMPNPSSGSVRCRIPITTPGVAEIRVVDLLGRTITTQTASAPEAGDLDVPIYLQEVGTYMIHATTGGRIHTGLVNIIR